MAPAKTGKTIASTAAKKEKTFHPLSRRAGQLARNALRKGKLSNLSTKRDQRHHSLVDLYGFFYHATPSEGVLSLEDLHELVRDVWLTRFDQELETERAARRKGRPKSAKQVKLENLKTREDEEYRTGMEVIDLTHEPTVEIFRRWDQKEVAFIQLLRFIRITSSDPKLVVISRPGKHQMILGSGQARCQVEMEDLSPTTRVPLPATSPISPAFPGHVFDAMDGVEDT